MRRLAALLLAASAPAFAATCPPAGHDTQSLTALNAGGWSLPEDRREAFALALVDCLGAADPNLRDDLAFGALQSLLRRKQLSATTVQTLRERLLADLPAADPQGVRRPFDILALAEVARVDRLSPTFTDAQRDELVATAAQFLRTVRDYRGFDEQAGWRHGVAHGSDLVLQLALNKALTPAQGERLLDAVLSQATPAGHAYVFGEPGRMAAAAVYLASRGWWDAAFWRGKLLPLVAAMGPRTSLQGLRDRHNLEALVTQLALDVLQGGTPAIKDALLPALGEAMKAFD